jgi:tRNA(Arg) A34 adenosine deaminase TadA
MTADILGDSDLSGALLFSTCESSPMCSSLAVWANLSAIVFGVSIEKTAERGSTRIRAPAREIVLAGEDGNHAGCARD